MYNGVTVVKIQKNSIISWKRILPLVASPSPHSLGTCWYFSLSIVLPFMWVFPPYFNYINVPFGPSLVDTFRGRRKIPSLWPAMNEVTWAKPLLICLERWRMLGFNLLGKVKDAGVQGGGGRTGICWGSTSREVHSSWKEARTCSASPFLAPVPGIQSFDLWFFCWLKHVHMLVRGLRT